MPCSVLPWQAAWQVILISFKIIITLRRVQKFGASAPNGTMKCRGHGVPEMVTPAMRTTAVLLGFLTWQICHDTGNKDNSSFARFFKLDKYAMFSFAMTSGLASDSDKFKIIITRRRVQTFGASAPNGTMKCRGHGVPEMVTPAMRTTAVLLGFLNLTIMPCSVLPWQAAWQVILISLKSS